MQAEHDHDEILRLQRRIFQIERMMYLLMAIDQNMLQFAKVQERMWSNHKCA